MSESIEVIFERGVFRPVGPRPTGIREGQRLTVTIADAAPAAPSPEADDRAATLDAVRQALAKIPGSLADAVITDRSAS